MNYFISDNAAENELIDNVEPPEVKLSAPALSQTIGIGLTQLAQAMVRLRCTERLKTKPLT